MASLIKSLEEVLGKDFGCSYDIFKSVNYKFYNDVKEAFEDILGRKLTDEELESRKVWKEADRMEVIDYLGWLNGMKFCLPNRIYAQRNVRDLVEVYRKELREPTNVMVLPFM